MNFVIEVDNIHRGFWILNRERFKKVPNSKHNDLFSGDVSIDLFIQLHFLRLLTLHFRIEVLPNYVLVGFTALVQIDQHFQVA